MSREGSRCPSWVSFYNDDDRRGRRPLAVLVEGSPVAGFALIGWVDCSPHLDQLAVHPARMRQGVGGWLVRAVLDQAARASALGTRSDGDRLSTQSAETDGVDVALAARRQGNRPAKRGLGRVGRRAGTGRGPRGRCLG
ncbi:GNAT family N-acetyltransferase [Nonomuraea sp. NPDC049152]|uniref:GNAT family N-acetyltransferase n=1 Tax=Nonomuraea sp. NPDC049152 TaxID=3154350 RepID=UPI0033EAA9C0